MKDSEQPAPLPHPRYRVGRSLGRTIYLVTGPEPSKDDVLLGIMDTRELGEMVVAALNQFHDEGAG